MHHRATRPGRYASIGMAVSLPEVAGIAGKWFVGGLAGEDHLDMAAREGTDAVVRKGRRVGHQVLQVRDGFRQEVEILTGREDDLVMLAADPGGGRPGGRELVLGEVTGEPDREGVDRRLGDLGHYRGHRG